MPKVKITVLKKLDTHDIFGDTPPTPYAQKPVCTKFEVGQEFEYKGSCPPNFCGWAFADIQRDLIVLETGGNFPWAGQPGVAISCCTDGLRPVVFKLERMEDDTT